MEDGNVIFQGKKKKKYSPGFYRLEVLHHRWWEEWGEIGKWPSPDLSENNVCVVSPT